MLFATQDRKAHLETGGSSAKYVYFPISSPLNIKTQSTKWVTRDLSPLQILSPKVNLYILMGMAVSFPPSIYLVACWLFTHWSPILKSVNFFLLMAFESTPRMAQSKKQIGASFFILMDVISSKFLNFAFLKHRMIRKVLNGDIPTYLAYTKSPIMIH